MRVDRRQTLWLLCILLFGLLLRFTYAVDHSTLHAFASDEGGDSGWYLANGAGFFSGQEHGRIRGLPFYMSNVSTPPLYLLFVGVVQKYLPDHETIIAIRLIQCLASTATAYLAFRLGTVIARDPRAGLVAAGSHGISPRYDHRTGKHCDRDAIHLFPGGWSVAIHRICCVRMLPSRDASC